LSKQYHLHESIHFHNKIYLRRKFCIWVSYGTSDVKLIALRAR